MQIVDRVENLSLDMSVEDYVRDYVDFDAIESNCMYCSQYKAKWSCPPYNFDVAQYWDSFDELKIKCIKIYLTEEIIRITHGKDEVARIMDIVMYDYAEKLREELTALEKEFGTDKAQMLIAGNCKLCGDRFMGDNSCTRKTCGDPFGDPKKYCVHYEDLRYSLESVGGNVVKTCELLGEKLIFCGMETLPPYMMAVGGLLVRR